MCTGAELAPLIMAAVGTGTSVVAQQQAKRKQDQEAARGIMQQAEIQRRAAARGREDIEALQTSNPEAEQASAQSDFTSALRAAAQKRGGGGATGAVSGRFSEEAAASDVAAGEEAGQTVNRVARIDAPQFQRLREGQSRAALASDLSLLEGESGARDFLTRLRTASQQPNPWLSAGGELFAGAGSALAGRAQPVKKKPMPIPPGGLVTETPGGTTTYFGGP